MTRLLLASGNAKKLGELRRILAEQLPGVEVVGLTDVPAYDEPVEDQPTFEGNALLKARAGYARTGLPCVADDSGLCVEALNQMPGVLSARWAGKPRDDDRNNLLLLDQLSDVPHERRGAHFACALAFVHDGGETVVLGTMPGRIIHEQRGVGGFGYDVVFAADAHPDVTTAELTSDQKDAISHRGAALRELVPHLVATLT
ncbi:non-canonical purine NTP pyrophosphatase [Nocardioides limicola]|uniref:non-canonical purine NTP pyrophosphatase n=1 Tax=Nocardioides limicola TaxID=2803368 RepID=UPI00193C63F6|nr:non-canonical purine NTP pyrophosphatase [Nocardioides sp. DJM-14]